MRSLVREVFAKYQPVVLPVEDRVPAAVLMLLYERDGEDHVLFQVRTHLVEHHKGEISLPGGRQDPGDDSLLYTALRETHEEIGVSPSDVEVLGRLDDVATRTNYLMSPFVGLITAPAPYPFAYAPEEVAMLLQIPLAHLLEGALELGQQPNGGIVRTYRYGEHLVFGATARVVGQFLDLLAPEVERARASEHAR